MRTPNNHARFFLSSLPSLPLSVPVSGSVVLRQVPEGGTVVTGTVLLRGGAVLRVIFAYSVFAVDFVVVCVGDVAGGADNGV